MELSGHCGIQSNILLADELGEMRTFQVGLVSDENVIPVTFFIPAERILADFSEGEPDAVQLYNEYAAAIPEEKLGFDHYHPYKGEIINDEGVVIHQVPEDISYNQTPATENVYISSFQATFGNSPEHHLVEAQTNLATFNESTELSTGKSPAVYYKYVTSTQQVFLVPRYGDLDSYSVEKALLGMKEPHNDRLELLVPEHVKYDVRVENEIAIISFKEPLDLSQMNHEDAVAMVEGFILTAHHFQSEVKLENVVQQSLGKYNLAMVLPEPAVVNPLNFNAN